MSLSSPAHHKLTSLRYKEFARMRGNSQDERAPLMGDEVSRADSLPDSQAKCAWGQPRQSITYYMVMVVLLLIPISFSVAEASQIQFFESVICEGYYKSHALSSAFYGTGIERPCKEKDVQAAVAHILSGQPVFNLAASMFKLASSLDKILICLLHRPFGKLLHPTTSSKSRKEICAHTESRRSSLLTSDKVYHLYVPMAFETSSR
jgi:hypothetical protein